MNSSSRMLASDVRMGAQSNFARHDAWQVQHAFDALVFPLALSASDLYGRCFLCS